MVQAQTPSLKMARKNKVASTICKRTFYLAIQSVAREWCTQGSKDMHADFRRCQSRNWTGWFCSVGL